MMNDALNDIMHEIRELRGIIVSATVHEMRPPKRLLSIEEACEYLGIGTTEGYARLRRHARTVKHGRRILIPREELESLIDRAKVTGRLFD